MDAAELPDGLAKKLPRYTQSPATRLGRLAIEQSLERQRNWRVAVIDTLRRSLEAAGNIAAMAVVVDAKDEAADVCERGTPDVLYARCNAR